MIKQVRGQGCLIGIELDRVRPGPLVDACREAGLLGADRRREGAAPGAAAHRGAEPTVSARSASSPTRLRREPARVKHVISAGDFNREGLLHLFRVAADLKQRWKAGRRGTPLLGRSVALIFEKQSLRTRVTFEVGIVQLGGRAVYLAGNEIGLRHARVGARRRAQPVAVGGRDRGARLRALHGRRRWRVTRPFPVINGLSDFEHPVPGAGRLLHAVGARPRPRPPSAWPTSATATTSANSVMLMGALLGTRWSSACPPGYEPDPGVQATVRRLGGSLQVTHDPTRGRPTGSRRDLHRRVGEHGAGGRAGAAA